jgi:septum formation protein
MLDNLSKYNIILASKSPRRQMLLKELGLSFTIKTKDTEEDFSDHLIGEEIALHLAEKKAHAFDNEMSPNDLIITADTIVVAEGKVLNKPANASEAKEMLRFLSGKMHLVFTGVCLHSKEKTTCFTDETKVFFRPLSETEIDFYVENYQPFDKAGSYGAQEWMGYVGVERIEGSYFNVMGLPVHKLYLELAGF